MMSTALPGFASLIRSPVVLNFFKAKFRSFRSKLLQQFSDFSASQIESLRVQGKIATSLIASVFPLTASFPETAKVPCEV